jgi:hypothetical protein
MVDSHDDGETDEDEDTAESVELEVEDKSIFDRGEEDDVIGDDFA